MTDQRTEIDREALSSPGFLTCSVAAPSSQTAGDERARPSTPDHLTLVDDDNYLATAHHDRLLLYRVEDLRGHDGDAAPIADLQTDSPVHHLDAWGRGDARDVIVALADDTVWVVEIPDPAGAPSDKPQSRRLGGDLGGQIRHLFCTRRSLLLVVEVEEEGSSPVLVEMDRQAGRILRRAPLPFDRLTALTPFDPDRSDLLLAIDGRHGAHLVGFPTESDAAAVQSTRFDPQARVTAATALDDQWVAIARKGGEVMQVRSSLAAGGRPEAAADVCRRLRALLAECGCDCRHRPPDKPCQCDEPAPPTDGGDPGLPTDDHGEGGRPGPGGLVDDEPCGEKHRANLGWTVAELRKVGRHLMAISAKGDRMAVLDHDLNVVFERYLGPRGALIAPGATSTDRLATLERGSARVGVWSLDEYVASIRGVRLDPGFRPPRRVPRAAPAVIFHGQRSQASTPNPHLKVAVFTVTEPGQAFGDPDQARMQVLLEPNVYSIVRDYYDENSFDTLDTEFSVFGVHLGTARRPLVLPRAIASYFYDDFTPGGIEAVMPGNWASPLVLDGTEAMTLRSNPAVGTDKDYVIPFAARWTSRVHGAYPIAVNFSGTETLQVTVQDQSGTNRALTLDFAALNLSHAQGDDETAFLAALGQHATNAVRAAETAAGSPQVLQDVVFRRIRSNDNDTQFGRLQAQFRVAATGGAQRGRVTIAPPASPGAGLVAIGFTDTGGPDGVLGSAGEISAYLAECLHAARFDADEGAGLNDPHLAASVLTTEDGVAQTVRVRIQLSNEKGGAGAEITRLTSSGLTASGWSTAIAVPGSTSTANNRNTMRDHQALANDVFTAAMNHLRATGGPWNAAAVRAQFADFDAMMIGFVGACPTTVPVADRWNCANAVDFGRLRMFVRHHQATDLNNPTPNDPVTMGTDLLIGQRFDQFDPGVMAHEIGHGLGLPDLYSATGFRDDVSYVDRWCHMGGDNSRFNHFCAWSKWSVGWIVESPTASLNRVVDVPMPAPTGTTTTEAWLVPVEYWDNSMRADVEADVGAGIPIGQMMKVHLGSDGGVVDLIEFRARGTRFSQLLPPTPAVIVTNVLQPGTDRRWAVNGLYRRQAHLLNNGNELTAVGDTWNFAAGDEFPVKGTVAEIVDLRTIRGGTIPICRVKVEREAAEFIDLHFQDNVPSWRSPDIYVDWPVDNADSTVPRTYPVGTPTDQGEVVRFPSSGVEPHFLVARPHNAGNVHAEDVKVRWFTCDPPGAGDNGRWVQRDTQTLPQVGANSFDIAPFTWNVDPATNAHQCLRAEIIDWTIPSTVDPGTGDTLALSSDDVILQNNLAQKNVADFEAKT